MPAPLFATTVKAGIVIDPPCGSEAVVDAGMSTPHGEIDVVGDHDNMLALIKKMTGGAAAHVVNLHAGKLTLDFFPEVQLVVTGANTWTNDGEIGVDVLFEAKAAAGRAGAEGVVEGEKPGLDFGDGEAGDGAGEFRREDRALAAIGILGNGETVGQLQGRLDGIGHAIAETFAKAGANIITFHPEASRHAHRTLQLIRDQGCQAGVVLNPGTPLSQLEYVGCRKIVKSVGFESVSLEVLRHEEPIFQAGEADRQGHADSV